jgi:hypothetical protein
MRRLALTALTALILPACGLPTVRPLTGPVAALQPVRAADSHIQGAYLSIDIGENQRLQQQAQQVRMQLGFLDMGQAIPKRTPDSFHVTVAYFRSLSPNSSQKLAQIFQRKTAALKVTGWGVANKQAAYFTVAGLDGWRGQIKAAVPEPFSGDDFHATFGVHPGIRKDVHGVPKPLQYQLAAILAEGVVHMKRGDHVVW